MITTLYGLQRQSRLPPHCGNRYLQLSCRCNTIAPQRCCGNTANKNRLPYYIYRAVLHPAKKLFILKRKGLQRCCSSGYNTIALEVQHIYNLLQHYDAYAYNSYNPRNNNFVLSFLIKNQLQFICNTHEKIHFYNGLQPATLLHLDLPQRCNN